MNLMARRAAADVSLERLEEACVPSKIPNSVIGAVASVIAAHYYSHSTLNSLFMESGAPGDVPLGNCETKCAAWLRRSNEDPSVNALAVLGQVIQKFMDQEPSDSRPEIAEGQRRIRESLAKNQLTYQINGLVTLAGTSLATNTLADYLKAGDFASIEAEFDRAINQLDGDPHAAITAASSIIEALCKTYMDTFGLEMPANQSIGPVWRIVQGHLGLNLDSTLRDDQKRVLQGLASIVDGVGAYRTHIGSAHGRGLNPPQIAVPEARLAVNAAHSLVIFVMELWHAARSPSKALQPTSGGDAAFLG
ncbi:abortive infection family protein [Thioalkalivibrio sp. ALE9]|uniref:abortive infection family protein n=1 Tax=Thioalkalivibrio sp. ALE9 TaxID=1158169 RepID=UPI0018C8DAE4|nr:abortive infection family protein [Thioalkalivibrio sp. ALE9]